MTYGSPIERLGRDLEAAAARQAAARTPVGVDVEGGRSRWFAGGAGCRRGGVGGRLAAVWGAPVPFLRGAPVKGESTGVPLPGTVKLLISDVADPAGGSPWALRYWETDRRYGCIQVGRLYQGRLGQIAGGKVFHELLPGVTGTALGGCFLLGGPAMPSRPPASTPQSAHSPRHVLPACRRQRYCAVRAARRSAAAHLPEPSTSVCWGPTHADSPTAPADMSTGLRRRAMSAHTSSSRNTSPPSPKRSGSTTRTPRSTSAAPPDSRSH